MALATYPRIRAPFLAGYTSPDSFVQDLPAPNTPGQNIPDAPGELGGRFDCNGNTYRLIKVDSGATSATPTGAIAAGQLAFWKDKSAGLVTNDRRMAVGAATTNATCNQVAGVFRAAITPGAYGTLAAVLVHGDYVSVASGVCGTIGCLLTADVDSNGPIVLGTAVGTAAPYKVLGVSRAAAAASAVYADIDIREEL